MLIKAEGHVPQKLRAGNLVRLQAGSAYIDSLGSAVYNCTNALDVGLPDVIGSSMRVAHIISEMSSLITIKTLCHGLGTPPFILTLKDL